MGSKDYEDGVVAGSAKAEAEGLATIRALQRRAEEAAAREHEQRLRANAAEEALAETRKPIEYPGISRAVRAASVDWTPPSAMQGASEEHVRQTLGLVLAALGLPQDTPRAKLLATIEAGARLPCPHPDTVRAGVDAERDRILAAMADLEDSATHGARPEARRFAITLLDAVREIVRNIGDVPQPRKHA